MPVLTPTEYFAKITWLGYVPHRDAPDIVTEPLEEMVIGWGGCEKDVHSGLTRGSCDRFTSQHPTGTEVANARPLSLTCVDETAEVAAKMGLDKLRPEWLGVSIQVQGIPDFSYLPTSSRLQAEDGTTLVVDLNNRPCQFPAKTIEQHHPGFGKSYKPAAQGLRGVMARVERPGCLKIGDKLRLHVPDQRSWAHHAALLSAKSGL